MVFASNEGSDHTVHLQSESFSHQLSMEPEESIT